MKRSAIATIVLGLLIGLTVTASAQKKTIIFVRHAERETAQMADQNDPPLSAAGQDRAERLVKRIGKLRPGAIYSTNYKRTRDTVGPLAKKRNKTIEIYDPSKPQDLISAINTSKTKRFVVVGHSNTIPPLVNLLTGKDLFKNLQEPEYSVIWVVKMKNGKVRKIEILDY
jgi:broad specificity phosphatase PhoE